jgi:hypothetical protein
MSLYVTLFAKSPHAFSADSILNYSVAVVDSTWKIVQSWKFVYLDDIVWKNGILNRIVNFLQIKLTFLLKKIGRNWLLGPGEQTEDVAALLKM